MAEPQTKTSTARKTGGKGTEPQAPAQSLNFRELVPPTMNVDFVGKRYAFIIGSSILNVLAIILFVTIGLNLSLIHI